MNFIFSRLMTKETAQMDYTADEYLHVGFPYTHADGCETELTLIDSAAFADVDKIELEAAYIARRIRSIMASDFLVTDGNERRRPTYGDFAVMLRSAKNSAAVIVKKLIECGIPAYSEEKESAFETLEVKIMLNLLRVYPLAVGAVQSGLRLHARRAGADPRPKPPHLAVCRLGAGTAAERQGARVFAAACGAACLRVCDDRG